MDTVNPFLDTGIGYVAGAEIGKAEADRTVPVVGYKDKIAPGINSVGFQPGW